MGVLTRRPDGIRMHLCRVPGRGPSSDAHSLRCGALPQSSHTRNSVRRGTAEAWRSFESAEPSLTSIHGQPLSMVTRCPSMWWRPDSIYMAQICTFPRHNPPPHSPTTPNTHQPSFPTPLPLHFSTPDTDTDRPQCQPLPLPGAELTSSTTNSPQPTPRPRSIPMRSCRAASTRRSRQSKEGTNVPASSGSGVHETGAGVARRRMG
jgi:hypothetical protein